jgi:hypothetical protein
MLPSGSIEQALPNHDNASAASSSGLNNGALPGLRAVSRSCGVTRCDPPPAAGPTGTAACERVAGSCAPLHHQQWAPTGPAGHEPAEEMRKVISEQVLCNSVP